MSERLRLLERRDVARAWRTLWTLTENNDHTHPDIAGLLVEARVALRAVLDADEKSPAVTQPPASGPDGGEYIDDHYRCRRCLRIREATNIARRRPATRYLVCDACDQVTTHELTDAQLTTPTTQETTTMTTTDTKTQTTDPRKPGWIPDPSLDRINLQRLIERLIGDARLIADSCNEVATETDLCSTYDRTTQGWNETMAYRWFAPRRPIRRVEVRGFVNIDNPNYDLENIKRQPPPLTEISYTDMTPELSLGAPLGWRDWPRLDRDVLAQKVASDLRYMVEQITEGARRENLADHLAKLRERVGGNLRWRWLDVKPRVITVTLRIEPSANDPASAEGFRQAAEAAVRGRMPTARVHAAAIEESS